MKRLLERGYGGLFSGISLAGIVVAELRNVHESRNKNRAFSKKFFEIAMHTDACSSPSS